MVQTCSRCARVNPEEAAYCYYDGVALGSHYTNGGPVTGTIQQFHSPFTFPSGQTCWNFDQLALACQESWAETLELLQQGYLESFLGGLGRADLALAAREAARFPDRDRGLDQLLVKLPSDVIAAPKLEVEPTEVNLGQLSPGEDRRWDLHLSNQGMRLLYGSVVCDNCDWLAVGEAPGAPQKLFQLHHELDIPVHVRGKSLRARNKPLEGRLLIESNGGTATVVVRAEVPVKPFPDGVLAGARNLRQAAEKAQAAPKEAAPLFESGAVARWFEANGWTYPVRGPVASDVAAVQQFFEALGVTTAPKVEINEQAVTLQGNVGVTLRHNLEFRSPERKPVYAHGTSDQPWLEVGRQRLNRRTAVLPLVVPAVPDHEGETLKANVTVTANGNQRFTVPVTLEVGGSFYFDTPAPVPAPVEVTPPPEPEPAPALPEATPAAVSGAPRRPLLGKWCLHAIPALVLGLALAGVVAWDLGSPVGPGTSAGGDEGGSYPWGELEDPEPRLGVKFSDTMRFGILMLKERDPVEPERYKRLTMEEDGRTNNTCIRLDGRENLFGRPPGSWARGPDGRVLREVKLDRSRRGWMSFWLYNQDKVQVRQTVEIVPSEQTHVLDTCLVHYLIENQDTVPHKVGLRVMIDTFIGSEDGVPFVIPGLPGLLETKRVFDQKEIPDFIEALERPNPTDPGTIAHMGLKLPGIKIKRDDPDLEAMEKLVVCRWPGNSEKRWQWDYQAMNEPPDAKKDSCVVMYWEDARMGAGERRAMAFTYGLGRIASGGSDLGLTVGGSFLAGKVFTVTAYVKNPQEGQKVKLLLPRGLSLPPADGGPEQHEEQTVDKGKDYSQVSWRVRAEAAGTYTLEVTSGQVLERTKVQIKKTGLFD